MKRTHRHITAALLLALYLPLVFTAQYWHVHGVMATGNGRVALAEPAAGAGHGRTDASVCPACQLASETGTTVQQIPSLPAQPGIVPPCTSTIPLQRLTGAENPRAPPCS